MARAPRSEANRGQRFRWTAHHDRAVALVADDQLTDVQIAAELGIAPITLARWKRHPLFTAAVGRYRGEVRARIVARGVRAKENRLDTLNALYAGLLALKDARAADPAMAGVPGGDTGLIVAKPLLVKVYEEAPVQGFDEDGKPIPDDILADREYLASVKRSVIVAEYAIDGGLIKSLTDVMKQAAIELGEWNEKNDRGDRLEEFMRQLAEFGRDQQAAAATAPQRRARLLPEPALTVEGTVTSEQQQWGMPAL